MAGDPDVAPPPLALLLSAAYWRDERRLSDGRVELVDTSRVEGSPLCSADLAPVAAARRTWTTYTRASLWVSMAHCIPTCVLASGLMAEGMDWRQFGSGPRPPSWVE